MVGYWLGSDWDESVKYLICVVSDLIPDRPSEGIIEAVIKRKVGCVRRDEKCQRLVKEGDNDPVGNAAIIVLQFLKGKSASSKELAFVATLELFEVPGRLQVVWLVSEV